MWGMASTALGQPLEDPPGDGDHCAAFFRHQRLADGHILGWGEGVALHANQVVTHCC